MLGSNQPKAGYEPTSSTQDLRHVEESIGIEPNTLTGTHCLAGKPYRHQGLLSVECGTAAAVEAPTLVIPLFVRLTGIEPITFRVSGGCSNQLSYKRWWR